MFFNCSRACYKTVCRNIKLSLYSNKGRSSWIYNLIYSYIFFWSRILLSVSFSPLLMLLKGKGIISSNKHFFSFNQCVKYGIYCFFNACCHLIYLLIKIIFFTSAKRIRLYIFINTKLSFNKQRFMHSYNNT